MEEAAFIKEEIFLQIVSPLMGVDNTAVLAISTYFSLGLCVCQLKFKLLITFE